MPVTFAGEVSVTIARREIDVPSHGHPKSRIQGRAITTIGEEENAQVYIPATLK